MKKVFLIVLALLAILAVFGACESKKGVSSSSPLIESQANPNAQYIRIGSGFGPGQPTYTIISSLNELNQFSRNLTNNSFWETEYTNAISKYSDNFFTNNFLVIVLLEENSGSNRHKVERVNPNGDIIIKQLIPEIGTADMATWSIIIELENSARLEQYLVVLE